MNFRVGQKVVCVNADPGPCCAWRGDSPKVGETYTVRRVFVDGFGELSLWLDELARSETAVRSYGPDVVYGAYRFRPLVSQFDFRSLVTPAALKKAKRHAGRNPYPTKQRVTA